MDSFYAAPRQPPVPTAINRIERAPVVPEVSVVENSFLTQPKFFTPFNHNHPIRAQTGAYKLNVEKKLPHENSLLKKHVRFESPSGGNVCHHSNVKETVFNINKENVSQPLKSVPNLNGKTFKQIYMANVPDRHLDLSVFEQTSNEIRIFPESKKLPESQPNILMKDNIKFDQFPKNQTCNYQYETEVLKSIENRRPFYPEREKMRSDGPNDLQIVEKRSEIAKPSDEPTIKDLFRIIQQQNEQIMILQRQVNNLKSSIRHPEPPQLQFENAQDRPFMKEITNSPSKKGMFSFDVKATSFEVSFRPQPGKFRKQNDFLEPKIQEIAECDDSKENEDISLHLEESLNMKDSYLSTVPSIQINMDEYQSSEEEEESVNPGITFYKDLMDQVNNVLKKMQAQSECQMATNKKKTNSITGQTMKAVKQATLQHLKSIGVNLSPIQETHEISSENSIENKSYDSSEVSFAVKQLLMKYLPDDKLTQAINKPKDKPNLKENNYKPGNGEFSFATLQYLKKYNIIDSTKRFPDFEKNLANPPTNNNAPKILDVTALKLQPKLL